MTTFSRRLLGALLLTLGMAGAARAAEPPAFGYSVICNDPALAQRLRSGVEARFARMHVAVRDRFPMAKLFIYANRDSNDTRNTEGVSIAIAHVSNLQTAALALTYIDRKEALPQALQAMLGEEGMLMHLNVAHMPTASDAAVDDVLDNIVTTFVRKYTGTDAPAATAGHP